MNKDEIKESLKTAFENLKSEIEFLRCYSDLAYLKEIEQEIKTIEKKYNF